MNSVFLLSHINPETEDGKLIGVYRTEANAHEAIERLRKQPGFKLYPEAFVIDEYALDQDHWTEGFVTVD